MKKAIGLILISVLATTAIANTSGEIKLPIPHDGILNPMGGKVAVPLSGQVIDDVYYDVTCHIENPILPEKLIVKLGATGTYCDFPMGCMALRVNGKESANQVELNQANNTIEFLKVSTGPFDQSGAVTFQNLDTSAHTTVSNCKAKPSL
jgi:hypothetical protein